MFVKLVRLSRDAELKNVNGRSLLNVNCVYDVGYGDNKKGQFLDLAMWGSQAEKLAPHLTKGKQIVVRADDIHIHEHNGKGYLKGTLLSIEFVAQAKAQDSHNEAKSNGYQPQTIDDDLPF
jgi:single-strand DNA-binding protein